MCRERFLSISFCREASARILFVVLKPVNIMKIALSQLNVTPGVLLSYQAKIADHIHKAAGGGADLPVCGELSLCGTRIRKIRTYIH